MMFNEIYCNPLVIAYQNMIFDALVNANNYFNFYEQINNPTDYTKLTDLIFEKIMKSNSSV